MRKAANLGFQLATPETKVQRTGPGLQLLDISNVVAYITSPARTEGLHAGHQYGGLRFREGHVTVENIDYLRTTIGRAGHPLDPETLFAVE